MSAVALREVTMCLRCDAQTISTTMVLTHDPCVLDAEPAFDGTVVLRNGTAHVLRAKTPVQADELRYTQHDATCAGWPDR